ncbi:MAG: hypothetical protein WDN04_13775 [Rhodospirillales bacterium]
MVKIIRGTLEKAVDPNAWVGEGDTSTEHAPSALPSSVSAPTGSYPGHWFSSADSPGWQPRDNAQKGIMPALPQGLPPAG